MSLSSTMLYQPLILRKKKKKNTSHYCWIVNLYSQMYTQQLLLHFDSMVCLLKMIINMNGGMMNTNHVLPPNWIGGWVAKNEITSV